MGVSWFAFRAYCLWLSALEAADRDSTPGRVGVLYRLPTETEWEWAASGGKRTYPWGDKEPNNKLANYDPNVGATTPVGRYLERATPEGLMDMAGNVWEWMVGWGDNDYDTRCLRGGSWNDTEYSLRCSYRDRDYLGARSADVGFRVVRS